MPGNSNAKTRTTKITASSNKAAITFAATVTPRAIIIGNSVLFFMLPLLLNPVNPAKTPPHLGVSARDNIPLPRHPALALTHLFLASSSCQYLNPLARSHSQYAQRPSTKDDRVVRLSRQYCGNPRRDYTLLVCISNLQYDSQRQNRHWVRCRNTKLSFSFSIDSLVTH